MEIGTLAFAIVFGCAVAWTLFDYARKVLVQHVPAVPLAALLALLQAPLFAIWVFYDGGYHAPPTNYYAPALGSVALNWVANALIILAIQISPLSLTIPLLSLTPAFSSLVAIPLLGQHPGPLQWVGIVLVVVGAFALHWGRGTTGGIRGAVRAFLHERGSVLMAIVALLWSLTPPLDKISRDLTSSAFHGLVLSAGVGLGLAVYLALRGRLGQMLPGFRHPGLLGATLATSAIALALQLMALGVASVAVLETVKRGLGNVAAAAVGRAFFREQVGAGQWVAVAVISLGVALILF